MIGLVWHRWRIAASPTAALKPGSKAGREQVPHACVVKRDVVIREHLPPTAVDPLVEESAGAICEHRFGLRHQFIAGAFHGLKSRGLNEGPPQILFELDAEKFCNPTHFAFEIRREIRVVNKQHVRPLSFGPIAGLNVEKERVGRPVYRTRCHLRGDPPPKELQRVGRRSLVGPANDGIVAADPIEQRNLSFVEAGVVIVHGKADIAAVPADVNVFDIVVERETVDRQMRFQETTMLHRGKLSMHLVRGMTETSFYPRRDRRESPDIRITEHQRTNYLLRPGRAALGGSRNDDVILAGRIAVPVAAVDDPRSVLAQCRPNEHGYPPFPDRDQSDVGKYFAGYRSVGLRGHHTLQKARMTQSPMALFDGG